MDEEVIFVSILSGELLSATRVRTFELFFWLMSVNMVFEMGWRDEALVALLTFVGSLACLWVKAYMHSEMGL